MPLASAIPYITAIAAVAGTGLSMAGNAQAQSAMNQARANEVAQQAQLQNQSNSIFQKSLAQSTPATAAQQMGQGQAARTNAWQTLNTATQPIASALPATTDGTTSSAQKRASTAANAWNTLNANAAAKEGSYGDWENQQNIKNSNAAQQLGVINNFSAGDASLLPTELQVASTKGDALSGWGTVVSMLGRVAGAANASGMLGSGSPQISNVSAAAPQVVDGPTVPAGGWSSIYA